MPHGFCRKGFHMPRVGIVALVAVHIHAQPALRRNPAEAFHRCLAVRHRALKVRDAAHYVHALVERGFEQCLRQRVPQVAVLRKGDELQVDQGGDLPPDLQQCFHRQ